jgi:hypothetical protein
VADLADCLDDELEEEMSELWTKRALFTRMFVLLLEKMLAEGYVPLIGKDGLKHMSGSLHYEGLAKDVDLFKDEEYLDKTEDHQAFGEYWESLHPDCKWGGRFSDGNHYSVTYLNKK